MSDVSEPSQTETTNPAVEDDDGSALERAGESIREARDAEGRVAANDDINPLDEARAGEHSPNPDGEGGLP